MEKELPSKFRFKANGYYYLAELSTQADAYNLSSTDEHGRDIRNLNNQTMIKLVQAHVKSGHWKIIEELFELPSKFTFIVGGNTYTAFEQEDKSYVVWFADRFKYEYSRDDVEKHVKRGGWVIQKEVEAIPTTEPTLPEVIDELPSKFTFTLGGINYTSVKQADGSYVVSWEKTNSVTSGSYPYAEESVKSLVKGGHWKINELIDVAEEKQEPTLLDAITEFTNTTNSNVTILPNENFYISCGFLGTEFEADNKEELEKLMAAATSLWNVVNGKK